MGITDAIYSTVANKCPRCHQGQVFENNNPYSFRNGFKMHKHCPECGLKYERETGYFYGAMYVSYAIQVAVFVALFTIDTLWVHMPTALLLSIIIGAIVALMPVTFRWSRIMWVAIFTKYEKGLLNPHKQSIAINE
jgi:uncharacterized protein (DUF983 family)